MLFSELCCLSLIFARTCAVAAGTYILGRPIKSITSQTLPDQPATHRLELEDMDETITANVIVASPAYVQDLITDPTLHSDAHSAEQFACAMVVLDGQISRSSLRGQVAELGDETDEQEQASIDAAVFVIPPGSLENGRSHGAVTAVINGESTLSCPSGKSKPCSRVLRGADLYTHATFCFPQASCIYRHPVKRPNRHCSPKHFCARISIQYSAS